MVALPDKQIWSRSKLKEFAAFLKQENESDLVHFFRWLKWNSDTLCDLNMVLGFLFPIIVSLYAAIVISDPSKGLLVKSLQSGAATIGACTWLMAGRRLVKMMVELEAGEADKEKKEEYLSNEASLQTFEWTKILLEQSHTHLMNLLSDCPSRDALFAALAEPHQIDLILGAIHAQSLFWLPKARLRVCLFRKAVTTEDLFVDHCYDGTTKPRKPQSKLFALDAAPPTLVAQMYNDQDGPDCKIGFRGKGGFVDLWPDDQFESESILLYRHLLRYTRQPVVVCIDSRFGSFKDTKEEKDIYCVFLREMMNRIDYELLRNEVAKNLLDSSGSLV